MLTSSPSGTATIALEAGGALVSSVLTALVTAMGDVQRNTVMDWCLK